ncbi:unnamed protein product [Miscanthus lutarioriparius]|uniref:Uncharacterized protein n=1 Tax=Miscanthus lutarioriparius TaxID=422564 RepID=A0A811M5I8_9POAL|nr:unnamed protein product [Miscanthus lutarioriparius]
MAMDAATRALFMPWQAPGPPRVTCTARSWSSVARDRDLVLGVVVVVHGGRDNQPAYDSAHATRRDRDNHRSFSLYRFCPGDLEPDLHAAETEEMNEKKQQAAAHYGRSRSETAREQGKKKQEARMSKSTSSGVVEEEAAVETEQCVDARADNNGEEGSGG